jgi:Ca2+-binding EF-hand superfamily protein
MSFDPSKFASEYCSAEEVLEIKRAFDLFDRDLGGAIDPRGTLLINFRIKSCHQCFGY